MRETITPVCGENLVGEVAKLKIQGYRLVTLSCTEIDPNTLDLLYHFDKDLALTHLRLAVAKTERVPSISPVYFAALLIENEIQDLFGIRFQGLVVDYQGTLYLEEEALQTPFCRFSVRQLEAPEPAVAAPAAELADAPSGPRPE
ncbi:MAG: NADH-quinone oxidoreductase subunit C [Desulfobacterales bacterium]